MNQEIVGHITSNEKNFEAYKRLAGLEHNIFRNAIEIKVLPFLKRMASKHKLEIDFDLHKFLANSRRKGFCFSNSDLRNNNLEISFRFESYNHRNMIYAISYIDKISSNKEMHLTVAPHLEKYIHNHRHNDQHLVFKFYDEYRNWRSLDTIQKMLYGNFEQNFEEKLLMLLGVNELITKSKAQ